MVAVVPVGVTADAERAVRVWLQSVVDRAGRNRARGTNRTQMVPAGRWQTVVAGTR